MNFTIALVLTAPLNPFMMPGMLQWIQRLLLCFPPETAHHLAIFGLRLYQWLWFRVFRRPLPAANAAQTAGILLPSLPTLKFRCRVGLAAGFDKNAEAFAGLARLGFGFIEVGTVTPLPQPGNPRPRIFREPESALVNSLGFNNCGIENFRRNILRYRRYVPGVPLFANLGKNKVTPNEQALQDYRTSAERLADCVDGFVINLSSPNTPGLFQLQTAEFLESLARSLPTGIPVWVKLSPDLQDAELTQLGNLVRDSSRLGGIVLTNTSRQLAEQLTGREQGGLSGGPLFERSLHCVRLARESVGRRKIVVGVGGIMGIAEARRMRDAGADLVEIYTGFIYRGPRLARELAVELE